MATLLTGFIERVGFLGVGQAIVQREKLTEAHIHCGHIICLAVGLILFGVFYVSSPWVAVFFEEPELVPVLRWVSMTFVIACIAEVPLSLLQREMKFKQLMAINNASFFIGNGVVGIILALTGFSYWSLVAATVAQRAVRLILVFRARPQWISFNFSLKEIKDLLHIGIGFSLGRLTSYWALVGDEFITGKLLGASALGLYSRAYQLMTLPAVYFGQILEKVLFAALSQRQSEPKKIAKFFLYGIELCSLVSIGGAIMLAVAAPEIITVLFGKQWLGAVPSVQILACGVFFRTCYKNSDTVIRALGAVYRLAFRQTLYAAVVIGGAAIGSRWGIEGVSYAVLFAVFLNYAVLSILCISLLDMPLRQFVLAHYPALWVGTWQLVAVALFFNFARGRQWNDIVSLLVGGTIEGVITLVAIWFAPRLFVPQVFPWMTKNLPFGRLGKIGKLASKFLARHGEV